MAKLNSQQINALVEAVSEKINDQLKKENEGKIKEIENSKDWKEIVSLRKQYNILSDKIDKIKDKLDDKYPDYSFYNENVKGDSYSRFSSDIIKRDLLIKSIDSNEIKDVESFINDLVSKYSKQ